MIRCHKYIGLFFLLCCKSVLACSCKGTNYSDAFFHSDSVVIGYIENIQEGTKTHTLVGQLTVTETLKGKPSLIPEIFGHSYSSVSCTQKLIEGEYIIFITNNEPVHITSCSSSHLIPNLKTKEYLLNLKENPPSKASNNSWLGLLDQMCQIEGDSMGEKCINGKWYWRGPDEI